MPLATSIQRQLDDLQTEYTLSSTAPADSANVEPRSLNSCLVKSVILKDHSGRIQLLLPAHRAVNLGAISRASGRQFQGVTIKEVLAMIEPLELSMLPAVPLWREVPLFVDSSISRYPTLLLESGSQDELLEIKQDDFTALTNGCIVGDFSKRLFRLESDPCKDSAQIQNSVQHFTSLRVRERLEETLDLPPLPKTAQDIIQLRANPDADISDLSDIIEVDPSLAAQVVSWAGSPYYSAPGKIRSVHDAIVRVLGFDMVLNLALGLALGRTMSHKAMTNEQITDYWHTAVITAATVEGLVTAISREHRPSYGMSYLCGLLSNFGTLILAEVFPPHFAKVSKCISANQHLAGASIEQDVLGVTGNQMAAWLLDNWNLPTEVVTGIRQQNNLNYNGEHAVYAKLIYVAQTLLGNHGVGHPLGGPLPQRLFEALHLDRETAEITVENVLDSCEELEQIAEQIKA